MSLIQRLKRRLGYDTTTTYEQTFPLYEYTVTHLNGEETVFKANSYRTDGAFARFRVICGAKYVPNLAPFVWSKRTQARVLEGIQEIEKIRVGESAVWVRVDRADGRVLESRVNIEEPDYE